MQEDQTTQPQQFEKKSANPSLNLNIWMISTIILLIVLLGMSLFLLSTKTDSPEEVNPTNTPAPQAPPTSTPTSTAPIITPQTGWTIYTNDKLNYQISVPMAWNTDEKNPDLKTWVAIYLESENKRMFEIGIHDWILEGGPEGIEYDADEGSLCVDAPNVISPKNCLGPQPPKEISKKSTSNLNLYYYVTKASGKRSAYIPVSGSNIKYIKIDVERWPENEPYELFDQIISTFRFAGNINTSSNPSEICTANGGIWLAEYSECERITEETCSQNNGIYNKCDSACRHNPDYPDVICAKVCVAVCKFS